MAQADLLINGIAVDSRLLEARPIRRCSIEECDARCCTGGVFVDTRQADDILAHTALIQPHLPQERRDPALWFDGLIEPDDDHPTGGSVTSTSVFPDATHPVGESCVFLRPDRKCALQVAGLAAGEHPWRFKPFYCALHPLVYDKKRLVLSEHSPIYQAGGSCHRPEADGAVPVYQLFAVELKLALGEVGYTELAALAEKTPGGLQGRPA
jgi:hypothetical protein